MNWSNGQLLAAFLVVLSVWAFLKHRRDDESGKYNLAGSYDNVSAVKHDLAKVFWTELFMVLVYGLASSEKFFDTNNFLESKLGDIAVMVTGYFIYHEVIQPYVVNMTPLF